MKRILLIFTLIFSLIVISGCAPDPKVTSYAEIGVHPEEDPIQENIDDYQYVNKRVGKKLIVKIKFKAEYNISAVVLHKKRYRRGWESKLAKYDLALGWGRLSNRETYKHIKWTQSNRWFYFKKKDDYPITVDYIYTHASNCHIIPATENIENAVRKLKVGEKIKLVGYLVDVDGMYKGGQVWWYSSMSRNDRGDGACEIIYVERLQKGYENYE